MSASRWVPLAWATWPTAKKIADLVRLCIVMWSSPAKLATGPAHAEGEGDDAHVLDRAVGKQPFDVAPAVEHEGGEQERVRPMVTMSGPGAMAPGLAAMTILKRRTA